MGDRLIGPAFLPEKLTGEEYSNFLEQTLARFLEDVIVATKNAMHQHILVWLLVSVQQQYTEIGELVEVVLAYGLLDART